MDRLKLTMQNASPSIPEEAWNKRGVTRSDAADRTGATSLPLTLDEAEHPQPMEFYDYAKVESFLSVGDGTVLIKTYCSFLEKKSSLRLTAHLKNKITGEYLGAAAMSGTENFEKYGAEAAIFVGSQDPRELAVVVEAEIGDGESVETLYLSDDSCIVSTVTLNPRYEHIYPKKEPVTVIFGNNPQGAIPAEFHSDPANIVISLYRVPQKSGDSDYVCNYGHGSHGNAILGIPAKGIIDFGRSVTVMPELINAIAMIERKDAGGISYVVREKQFEPPIVKNGKIQYEVKTNWECELNQQGNLKPYYYDYTLSFTVKYRLNASEVVNEMKFTASNKVHTQNFNGAELVYPLLPLKIMWGCLAENTRIRTVDGMVRIQEIQIGDRVICPESGKETTVSNIWYGRELTLLQIICGDKNLMLTYSHPVAVVENGVVTFRRADAIRCGELIKCEDGVAAIDEINAIKYNGTVYNLMLDGTNHSFYAEGIAVGDIAKQNEVSI